MLNRDKRDEAEKFIETVIAPRREAWPADTETISARTKLANEERKLAASELAEAGFDPDRLDKFAAERSAKRRKLADQGRRRAIETSSAVGSRLAELAPIVFPFEPLDAVINEMLFIRSFAGQGSVTDSSIGPSDNWARYRLQSDSDLWDGVGRLSFFALWQNTQDEPVVVSARPQLIVNARLNCDAEWSGVAAWFGMESIARGSVSTRTTVWGMTSGVSSVVNEQELGKVDVAGGFFGDDGAGGITLNELLPSSAVVVLANAYVMIEVEILTAWVANHGGTVVLDADSGAHRVDVPQIMITHIGASNPPQPGTISLTAVVTGGGGGTPGSTVTLVWSGATGPRVDIYQNGVKVADTENDDTWAVGLPTGSYTFRVCETNSSVCSTDVPVTVP